jgi:RNA polymerase sigma-70 factor (ECF subfamily)
VSEGATAARGRARFTGPALVNGSVGLARAPHGRLFLVLTLAVTDNRITEIDVVADADRLSELELAVLDD